MSEKEWSREEENSVISMAQRGDQSALDRIIARFLPLVQSAAYRFMISFDSLPREDLIQAGVVGLLLSVHRFTPECGTSLSTYAFPWILGEMRRSIKKAVDHTGMYAVCRRMTKIQENLSIHLGRSPTLEELSNASGLSAAMAAELISLRIPISLDRIEENGSNPGRTLNSLCTESEISDLRFAISSLAEEERKLVLLRFFRDMTQKEAARFMGKSQSQISRIEQKALEHLKEQLI